MWASTQRERRGRQKCQSPLKMMARDLFCGAKLRRSTLVR